jgi:hypothetical protein
MSKWTEKLVRNPTCSPVSISEQTSEQVFDQTDVFLLTTPTSLPFRGRGSSEQTEVAGF